MAMPLRNILRLSVGDGLAKGLAFLAMVYLARTLGVESYGILEFAISVVAYFQLMADGGLELWATREVARGAAVRQVAAVVVPLRLVLATLAMALLWLALPLLPGYPGLRALLLLYGAVLFAQAVDLKWALLGGEKNRALAAGLVLAQVTFAALVFFFVRSAGALLWVPVARVAGDLSMTCWYAIKLRRDLREPARGSTAGASWAALAQGWAMGASRALALLSYNFDSLVLGFLLGATAVGLYGAAYRPLAAFLAVSSSYFLALFPVLSRAHRRDLSTFNDLVRASLELTTFVAVPVGICGYFFGPVAIRIIYGSGFEAGIPAIVILACSVALVLIRGTFRQALCAAGAQRLDLLCAALGSASNIALNFTWIPRYGLVGAAWATVASEVVWLVLIVATFKKRLGNPRLLRKLLKPGVAGLLMAGGLWLTVSWAWPARLVSAMAVYLIAYGAMAPATLRSWLKEDR